MKLFKKEVTDKHVKYRCLGFKFSIKRKDVLDKYVFKTYSQLGEDVLFKGFLKDEREGRVKTGFYVDIGAHHPSRYSNTKLFYDKGWRGINIEPMSDIIDLFNKERPSDINVNVAISDSEGEMDYYMFSEHGINTLSKEFADTFINDPNTAYKYIGVKKIPVMTLESVLDMYLPEGQHIDLLDIDAEGLDIKILKSNNWEKYSPDFVLIEVHSSGTIKEVLKSDVSEFLTSKGYELCGQAFHTSLFCKSQLVD